MTTTTTMTTTNDEDHESSTSTSSTDSTTASSPSRLYQVLEAVEDDLHHVDWPLYMGVVLHPLCDNVLRPGLQQIMHTKQDDDNESELSSLSSLQTQQQQQQQSSSSSFVHHLPQPVDIMASALVGTVRHVVKLGYGIIPHSENLKIMAAEEITKQSQQWLQLPKPQGQHQPKSISNTATRASLLASIQKATTPSNQNKDGGGGGGDALALVFSGIGFLTNTVLEFVTKPVPTLVALVDSIQIFVAFLIAFGIDQELLSAFATMRLITNIILVARIQGTMLESMTCTNRRNQAALATTTTATTTTANTIKRKKATTTTSSLSSLPLTSPKRRTTKQNQNKNHHNGNHTEAKTAHNHNGKTTNRPVPSQPKVQPPPPKQQQQQQQQSSLQQPQSAQFWKESQRYMQFSTAAYGTFQIKASGVLSSLLLSSNDDYMNNNNNNNNNNTDDDDASGGDSDTNTTADTGMGGATLMHMNYTIVMALQQRMTSIVQTARRRRIANYLNINPNTDILFMTPPGGDFNIVRHFVAMDHATKSIVLAIRGTYSTSDISTDINVMTTPFYGGVAHKGMADRAEALWENSATRFAIEQGLASFPTYRLVLTGHSLGAGVAALLNIKLHVENDMEIKKNKNKKKGSTTKISTVPLKCFGFACPPTFYFIASAPTTTIKGKASSSTKSMKKTAATRASAAATTTTSAAAIGRAIANTVCYINSEDAIPFLSTDSVRRLANMLTLVDNITKDMNPWDRFRMRRGWIPPSQELIDIVTDGSQNLEPIANGAERLEIPARFVVWMMDEKRMDNSDDVDNNNNNTNNNNNNNSSDAAPTTTTNAVLCDPSKLSSLSILLADNMILDHLPPRYEERLDDLVESNTSNMI